MYDPRLADTGHDLEGREIIDDQVLLADFERFLEIGEQWGREELEEQEEAPATAEENDGSDANVICELMGFIDRHRRQLLELAKRGAGLTEE